MGDNGGLENKEIKTPEQVSAERLERYNKCPESFIEMSDIILCCIRNPNSGLGISVYVGNCLRKELDIASMELQHIAHKRLISMDVESEMKHSMGQSLIHKPGIMDFVRKRKR